MGGRIQKRQDYWQRNKGTDFGRTYSEEAGLLVEEQRYRHWADVLRIGRTTGRVTKVQTLDGRIQKRQDYWQRNKGTDIGRA